MFIPIHFRNFPTNTSFSSFNYSTPYTIQQITTIAINIFAKIKEFLQFFIYKPREINLKMIATIGCLSLISLFTISMLRSRREPPHLLIPPMTPQKIDRGPLSPF